MSLPIGAPSCAVDPTAEPLTPPQRRPVRAQFRPCFLRCNGIVLWEAIALVVGAQQEALVGPEGFGKRRQERSPLRQRLTERAVSDSLPTTAALRRPK